MSVWRVSGSPFPQGLKSPDVGNIYRVPAIMEVLLVDLDPYLTQDNPSSKPGFRV